MDRLELIEKFLILLKHLLYRSTVFCHNSYHTACIGFLTSLAVSPTVRIGYNDFMKGSSFTSQDVRKIAKLAHIPLTEDRAEDLAQGFTKTMKVVDNLTQVDVTGVEPTNQVTGLENVFREDEIDTTRMFTQEQALSQSRNTHNGYFVVDRVLEDKS